ncbi:Hypothetical predicted protein [Cloeon dipterum]|uniref:V-type proton ATPase subunit E n=1 Tax=Cloeon dipterum TaxID=197152 RepID=A0A8S1DHF5_9INSE|nr:Hypothetical predicted protein [Cloeon dipterum]
MKKMVRSNNSNPAKVFCKEEIQRQVSHMTAFIDQEADEKVAELDAKAEEEYNLEKGTITNQERVKITDAYIKKEKQIRIQKQIATSNYNNQLRLKVLAEREAHVNKTIEETRESLGRIAEDREKYLVVMRQLILQGVLQFLESNVTLRVREEDVDIARSVIDAVTQEYTNITGKNCEIVIDDKNYLPVKSCGGVILYAQNERMKIVNTLDARLTLITSQVIPAVRVSLFGENTNRKFYD